MNPWLLVTIWLLAVFAIGIAGILLPQRGPTLEESVNDVIEAFKDLRDSILLAIPGFESLLLSVNESLEKWEEE